jgi:hypothetical protein
MKRIGAIYNRDTSKSKDKITKPPLKDIDFNLIRHEHQQKCRNKRWKLELDN